MLEIITTCIQIIFVKKLTSTFGNVHRVDLEEFSKVGNHLRCSECCCYSITVAPGSPPSPSPGSLESHCTSSLGPSSVVGGWNMIQFRSLYFPLTLGCQLPALTTKQFITASFLLTMFLTSPSAHLAAVVGNVRWKHPVLWQCFSCDFLCCCGAQVRRGQGARHRVPLQPLVTPHTLLWQYPQHPQQGAGDTLQQCACCHSADNMKHLEICSACSCCGKVRNCEQLQQ